MVQTSWALLALMGADCKDAAALQRGVALLRRRQLSTGDWAQENVAGVWGAQWGDGDSTNAGTEVQSFHWNHAAWLHAHESVAWRYTAFRNVFPLWAVARFAKDYGPRHGCNLSFA